MTPPHGLNARSLHRTFARAHGGTRLTASGVYYLPFAGEPGPQGASELGLHVADGSRIYAGRVSGPSLGAVLWEAHSHPRPRLISTYS